MAGNWYGRLFSQEAGFGGDQRKQILPAKNSYCPRVGLSAGRVGKGDLQFVEDTPGSLLPKTGDPLR